MKTIEILDQDYYALNKIATEHKLSFSTALGVVLDMACLSSPSIRKSVVKSMNEEQYKSLLLELRYVQKRLEYEEQAEEALSKSHVDLLFRERKLRKQIKRLERTIR